MLKPEECGAVLAPPEDSAPATEKPVSRDPYTTFLATKNFGSLNGVRCISCLGVILAHSQMWKLTRAPGLVMAGHGVDIFFVVSGFLIVTLLIRERKRRGSISLKKFYARRTLRIFPIYYLLIFLVFGFYLLISPWRPGLLRYYLPALPVLLTYTQDVIAAPLGPFFYFWSLAMEEQFYLVWPTIEKFVVRQARWLLLGAMLLINQAVNFGYFDWLIDRIYGSGNPKLQLYTTTFTPILIGVVLAYLLSERRSYHTVYRIVGNRWSPLVFTSMLIPLILFVPDPQLGFGRLLMQLIFGLMVASLVIREDHVARPILAFGPIDRIGVISYGIYLYHFWVIDFFSRTHIVRGTGIPAGLVMFVVASIGTVVVAEVSYRFIEQPLLRVKERFHS